MNYKLELITPIYNSYLITYSYFTKPLFSNK
jgi:hypothetical protein